MPSSPKPVPRSTRTLLLALLGGNLFACNKDEEVSYEQFNASDDTLDVEVGVAELLDAVSIDLHSTTGQVVIGTASVDPGGGPIGTEHTVSVEIADDYENKVDRCSVRTDSGDRGKDEFDMDPDSADEGFYSLSLVSVGESDEQRTDTLTIRVWDIVEDEDGDPVETGDTGS